MLYLAVPWDLRDRYPDGTWLVYARMIEETAFTNEDTLIVAEWLQDMNRSKLLDIAYHAKQDGARVIYMGSTANETNNLKRQLCLMGVYDWLFFGDEVSLPMLDELIKQPKTPADRKKYLGNQDAPGDTTVIASEEELDVRDRIADKIPLGGFLRRERNTDRFVAFGSKFIVVTQLWPRSGSSFIAANAAYLLSQRYPANSVTLVEHPAKAPRMYQAWNCADELYRHWYPNQRLEIVEHKGIDLIPLIPDEHYKWSPDMEVDMLRVLYRVTRKPVTIMDGLCFEERQVIDMADLILVVIDVDPGFLGEHKLAEQYAKLVDDYGDKVIPVLNKVTKAADVSHPEDGKPIFDRGVYVPYMQPEIVQEALWKGEPAAKDGRLTKAFSSLTEMLVRYAPSKVKV